MDAAKPKARRWPHPDTPLPLTGAAAVLGAHRSTLARNVDDLRSGGAARSPRPEIAAVCAVYAARPEGSAAKPPAREVIAAAGDDPSDFEGEPRPKTPAPRLRVGKKEIGVWRRLPPERLADEMREAWNRMEARETKNAKRRVLEIAEALRRAKTPMPEPWITPESVMVFASMADWAARAPGHAVWPFLLSGASRRPVDLMSATRRETRVGEPELLTLSMYASALAAALLTERLSDAEAAMEGAAGPGKAPPRNRKLR